MVQKKRGRRTDYTLWVAALEDEYEAITYDYRAHGETRATDQGEYSVKMLAEDSRGLVEELGLERPVLCGHSYGGVIAAEYAVRYPDDVAGFVFADARTDIGESFAERAFFRLQPVLNRVEDIVGRERVQQVMGFVNRRVTSAEQGPDEEVPELGMTPSEYSEAGTEATPDEELLKVIGAGMEYVGTEPTDFHVPVLYAYGELTGDVIADKAERLERAPTDVRVEEIDNGGHGFPLEQPEAFGEVLREFLADAFAERGGMATAGETED